MVTFTSLVVVAIVVVTIYFLFNNNPIKGSGKKLPGPKGLPYLGSIFSVKGRLHETFSKWVKPYGKVFSVKLLGNDIVVISDPRLAREAFNNQALLGRPHNDFFEAFSNGRRGVISTDGPEWVEQRRFALRNLRDFGFGKSSMEESIMEEVTEFNDWLKSGEGTPTMLDRKFNFAVVNSLWKILTGNRLKQNDKQLHDLLVTVQKGLAQVSSSPLGLFFPKLVQAFPIMSGWANITNGITELLAFIQGSIDEHKATFSFDFQRDFLDAYLKEMKTASDPKSSFYGEYGAKSLESVMLDLFFAGSETTSATLTWSILYLTTFPEKLEQLQKEIDAVIGKTRMPSLSDREKMPYTEAVLYETLRYSSLVALGVFHYSTQNTKLSEYDIPKGSWICLNQYHIHNDPEIWGDPENFRPERFLSQDGKSVKKHEALVPFSVGKRICLGESLARDELFLFLTSIVQRFIIELDPNSPHPGLQAPNKQFLQPPKFHAIFKDRT